MLVLLPVGLHEFVQIHATLTLQQANDVHVTLVRAGRFTAQRLVAARLGYAPVRIAIAAHATVHAALLVGRAFFVVRVRSAVHVNGNATARAAVEVRRPGGRGQRRRID